MTRDRAVRWIVAVARQPEVLAFLPALSLAAYWLGGEHALLVTALAVPLLCAIAAVIAWNRASHYYHHPKVEPKAFIWT